MQRRYARTCEESRGERPVEKATLLWVGRLGDDRATSYPLRDDVGLAGGTGQDVWPWLQT